MSLRYSQLIQGKTDVLNLFSLNSRIFSLNSRIEPVSFSFNSRRESRCSQVCTPMFSRSYIYREQPDLRDTHVMRALDALIDVYRAETRGHAPKEVSLPEPEDTVFQRTQEMCELRLGRQTVARRIQVPFAGDKTASDILACLRKIRRSVERWNRRGGQQGYLQFVSEFVT
jgi:hypothetical protein